jgi:hypothetical protein
MADQIFPIVFGAWILLGAAGVWPFYVSRHVAFKRKYFPWYVGLAGVLLLGVVAAAGYSLADIATMVPSVALVCYLNLRATRFCDACGRTIIQQRSAEFCSKCGARVADRPVSP